MRSVVLAGVLALVTMGAILMFCWWYYSLVWSECRAFGHSAMYCMQMISR